MSPGQSPRYPCKVLWKAKLLQNNNARPLHLARINVNWECTESGLQAAKQYAHVKRYLMVAKFHVKSHIWCSLSTFKKCCSDVWDVIVHQGAYKVFWLFKYLASWSLRFLRFAPVQSSIIAGPSKASGIFNGESISSGRRHASDKYRFGSMQRIWIFGYLKNESSNSLKVLVQCSNYLQLLYR